MFYHCASYIQYDNNDPLWNPHFTHSLNFLQHAAQSQSFPPQNAVHFITLSFLVHMMLTLHNGCTNFQMSKSVVQTLTLLIGRELLCKIF